MSENVFLIGFMGSGKTTVAKLLSKKINYTAYDIDKLIVSEQGINIADIFERFGESYFRKIESKILKSIIKNNYLIISTGGGIVLDEGNRVFMKKNGRVVFLKASAEKIVKNLKNDSSRPLLEGANKAEKIAMLLKKRISIYEELADIIIETDHLSLREVSDEIEKKLSFTNQS